MQEWDLNTAEAHVRSKRPQAHPYIDAWNTSRARLLHGRDADVKRAARVVHDECTEVCLRLHGIKPFAPPVLALRDHENWVQSSLNTGSVHHGGVHHSVHSDSPRLAHAARAPSQPAGCATSATLQKVKQEC